MRIIVRLPNWLGDLVMSSSFTKLLQQEYPNAIIDVIVKEELTSIAHCMPNITNVIGFSKKQNPGVLGPFRFGKTIVENYDLGFCLPNSFSSAFMFAGIKCKTSVGYKSEIRNPLLTLSYKRPSNVHRIEEYNQLLQLYVDKKLISPLPQLSNNQETKFIISGEQKQKILFNFRSQASSRSFPLEKAIEIIRHFHNSMVSDIYLVGIPADTDFNENILKAIESNRIHNYAGKTSLLDLTDIIGQMDLIVTTDSGPAHLSNALGKKTIVLFGAGDEKSTAPMNSEELIILRSNFKCACQVSNNCRYKEPKCLIGFDPEIILQHAQSLLSA